MSYDHGPDLNAIHRRFWERQTTATAPARDVRRPDPYARGGLDQIHNNFWNHATRDSGQELIGGEGEPLPELTDDELLEQGAKPNGEDVDDEDIQSELQTRRRELIAELQQIERELDSEKTKAMTARINDSARACCRCKMRGSML